MISLAEGSYLKGIVSVTGTVKSGTNPGISWKLLANNGGTDNLISEGFGEVNGELAQWDTRNKVDGNWNIKLEVYDSATLNFLDSAAVSVNLDNTPPDVNITLPANGSNAAGIINILGRVLDDNLKSYELKVIKVK